jgi:hypothetical protein
MRAARVIATPLGNDDVMKREGRCTPLFIDLSNEHHPRLQSRVR